MIYILFLLGLIALSFLNVNIKFSMGMLAAYCFATIALILFAGLRVGGYDFDNYTSIFKSLRFDRNNDALLDSLTEPGFSLIVKLFNLLNIPFAAFVALVAFFAVALKSKFFLAYSKYPFFSLVIYFSVAFLIKDMGQIRHGLAMGIVLISFAYLFKRKVKMFLLFILLAFLFHASAIIVLPAYWIAKIKIRPLGYAIITLILFPLLFVDIRPVFLALLGLTSIPQIQSKATFYLYSEEFGSQLGLNISVILRLATFGLMLLFNEQGRKIYYYYDDLVKLYFYGIVLYILFNSVSDFAIRSSDYFRLLDCIILPFFVFLGKTRVEKNVLFPVLLLYSLLSLYKLFSSDDFYENYMPYKTIFSSQVHVNKLVNLI